MGEAKAMQLLADLAASVTHPPGGMVAVEAIHHELKALVASGAVSSTRVVLAARALVPSVIARLQDMADADTDPTLRNELKALLSTRARPSFAAPRRKAGPD